MQHNFKVGDRVVCINATGCGARLGVPHLAKDCEYIIAQVRDASPGQDEGRVSVQGCGETSFLPSRFRLAEEGAPGPALSKTRGNFQIAHGDKIAGTDGKQWSYAVRQMPSLYLTGDGLPLREPVGTDTESTRLALVAAYDAAFPPEAVNPTHQHARGCPRLYGEACACGGPPLARPFREGDRLVCVNNDGVPNLSVGTEYEAVEDETGHGTEKWVGVTDDNSERMWPYAKRFRLLAPGEHGKKPVLPVTLAAPGCGHTTRRPLAMIEVPGNNAPAGEGKANEYLATLTLAVCESEAIREARRGLREVPFCGHALARVEIKTYVFSGVACATLWCSHCAGGEP